MKPRKPLPEQDDLLRARLDEMIAMRHELVKLAALIDWDDLAELQPAAASAQSLRACLAFQPSLGPPDIGIKLSQLVDHFSGGTPVMWLRRASGQ
ncbi:hypothetical protein DU478_21395 [Thalassococcus profundi]|uniref:IS5/IS1182 family transposase n=1 Tax=Thalassococcus profundi TaxID=2282382 RepID=A0A369TML3_9RHOB|nr:hypothetical protein DU478_21395 [Thalassococcus profundi]